jgi:hypothetical protein
VLLAASGGMDAPSLPMLYVRGATTSDASTGFGSFLSAYTYDPDGTSFTLSVVSKGEQSGMGVAGVAVGCRSGDTGYAPGGTMAVGPYNGELLLADSMGILLLAQSH